MAILIRKQLTIADHHEAWLKRKASETGESEAAWVRRALDLAMEEDLETRGKWAVGKLSAAPRILVRGQ